MHRYKFRLQSSCILGHAPNQPCGHAPNQPCSQMLPTWKRHASPYAMSFVWQRIETVSSKVLVWRKKNVGKVSKIGQSEQSHLPIFPCMVKKCWKSIKNRAIRAIKSTYLKSLYPCMVKKKCWKSIKYRAIRAITSTYPKSLYPCMVKKNMLEKY